jgi:serine O-acetyltransferase
MNDTDPIWSAIRSEAVQAEARESILSDLLHQNVLDCASLEEALSRRLSRKLGHHALPESYLYDLFVEVFKSCPIIGIQVREDIQAIRERDPACKGFLHPLLYFKGFQALTAYRVAHQLYGMGRTEIAFYLQSLISEVFSVDIHPAARIDSGILLDHATSLVVGETAVIEKNVSLLHEVTLGGTGKETGDRHPKVREGVLIGAGAKILGNVEIGIGAKVGAGSVVLSDVPPHATVAGVPAKVVGQTKEFSPSQSMDHRIEFDG